MARLQRWWRGSVAARRIRIALGVLLADVVLVAAVLAGVDALRDQLVRHGEDTVRVTATVTDTVRQCGKGGCHWLSLGSYTVAGTTQRDVVVVDGSRREITAPQTVLVDPAQPRRAVNLHDHGQWALVIGPLGLVGLVVVQTFAVRRFRRSGNVGPTP